MVEAVIREVCTLLVVRSGSLLASTLTLLWLRLRLLGVGFSLIVFSRFRRPLASGGLLRGCRLLVYVSTVLFGLRGGFGLGRLLWLLHRRLVIRTAVLLCRLGSLLAAFLGRWLLGNIVSPLVVFATATLLCRLLLGGILIVFLVLLSHVR